MIRVERELPFYWLLFWCILSGVILASTIPDDIIFRERTKSDNGHCTTLDHKQGVCIELRDCKKLYEQIVADKIVHVVATEALLRNSRCSTAASELKVCCTDRTNGSYSTTTSTAATTSTDASESKAASTTNAKIVKTSKANQQKPIECGTSTRNADRIFGGKPASLGDWPWMVALGYRKWSDPSIRFRCGASLIANQWLLTAAHCVVETGSYQLVVARLGDLDLDPNAKDNAAPIDAAIERFIVHPSFYSDRRNNDIALVHLRHKVEFTRFIQPICLLSGAEYQANEFYKKKQPLVIGWGLTENGTSPTKLQEAPINVIELSKCTEQYNKLGQVSFSENLICAGDHGRDSCQGDSGGPLIFVNATTVRFYLGGVVSAGKECGTDYPGLYIRVAKFVDWINENTGLNF